MKKLVVACLFLTGCAGEELIVTSGKGGCPREECRVVTADGRHLTVAGPMLEADCVRHFVCGWEQSDCSATIERQRQFAAEQALKEKEAAKKQAEQPNSSQP